MSARQGGNAVMTVQKPEGYPASPGFRRQAGLNSSSVLAGCGGLGHLVLFADFTNSSSVERVHVCVLSHSVASCSV